MHEETRIDVDGAIRTAHLLNPQFIGNFIDMVMVDPMGLGDQIVLVATATEHPRNVPPGFGAQGGPTLPQQDESIRFWRIER